MLRAKSASLLMTMFAVVILAWSCSPSKLISKSADKNILQDTAFSAAHTGIAVFDPGKNEYLFRYQDKKYFVPASNTKIITCYVAMKNLGEKITGMYYTENDTALIRQHSEEAKEKLDQGIGQNEDFWKAILAGRKKDPKWPMKKEIELLRPILTESVLQ